MDSPRSPTDDSPPARPGPQPERTAAGTVFTVMVGTLLLAALLNADRMLARAEASELGWRRDVSLLFWRPVEGVSSSVGLSAPRSGLDALRDLDTTGPKAPTVPDEDQGNDSAVVAAPMVEAADSGAGAELGHKAAGEGSAGPQTDTMPSTAPVGTESGAPEVVEGTGSALSLGQPETEPGSTLEPAEAESSVGGAVEGPLSPTKPGLPGLPPLDAIRRDAEPDFALRRPTADDPLRILIVGDSTLDSVGSSMLRELEATGVTSAVLDYRISTGLSRPDFFDWPVHLAGVTPQLQPEVVVIMLGANDAQAFAIDSQVVEFGTELWFDTYRARVAGMLEQLSNEGRWIVWIGQPVMRTPAFDAKMRQVNQLFVEEVARHPTATFVDSRTTTVDADGGYAAFLTDAGGSPQQVRRSDGIHFTTAGGDRLAPVVIAAINEIAPLY